MLLFLFVISISFLSRCIPDPSYLISKRLPIIRKFLDIIDLDDLFRKCLSDIYTAWREILALCGIAVGKYFCVICCICQWLSHKGKVLFM